MSQLELSEIRSPDCPFTEHTEDDDNRCNSHGMSRPGYEILAEDSPDIDHWLQEVNWVGLNDIQALNLPVSIPTGYIPTITDGSGSLFSSYKPASVAVRLHDVVSPEKLRVATDLKRLNIPPGTEAILLCYGKDRLIENIWPKRDEIFPQLAKLGFSAVTSINYSVWDSQPHAERLINIKRSLLTYKEMQILGIPAIPHIYWHGRKNLDAWLVWLSKNPLVNAVAINLQTLRKKEDWARALSQLGYFVNKLERPLHFLITGAHTPERLMQLKKIMPILTLTNGSPARRAFASHRTVEGNLTKSEYSRLDKSSIFQHNVKQYEKLLKPERRDVLDALMSRNSPFNYAGALENAASTSEISALVRP